MCVLHVASDNQIIGLLTYLFDGGTWFNKDMYNNYRGVLFIQNNRLQLVHVFEIHSQQQEIKLFSLYVTMQERSEEN